MADRVRVAVARDKFQKAWPSGDRSEYEVLALEDALARVYETDAHLVTYVVQTPATHQPRLLKTSIASYPLPVTTSVLFCDVDNPGHAETTPEMIGTVPLETEGIYWTKRGYRLMQPLGAPIATASSEAVLFAWLTRLEVRGIAVDWACRDWTRHFRLPNVRRDKKAYLSPGVDLSRMCPIHIEAAALPVVATPRPKASRGQAAPAAFAPSVGGELGELAERVARGASIGAGERHAFSMALAGAAAQLRMAPEQVPAFVRTVSALTGAAMPAHHEKNARDTVAKHARGEDISGIVALRLRWPGAAAALERREATAAAPTKVVLPDGYDGLRLVAAECGMGKTRAAEELAERRAAVRHKSAESTSDRAPAGSKTSIAVDKSALAVQVVEHLRARGVAVKRLFGPLSVEGEHECQLKEAGKHFVAGGQSLTLEFCEGRRKKRCQFYATCTARLGYEGPSNARVAVGPHKLLPQLSEAAGTTGLLIIDEPPPLVETKPLDIADVDIAIRNIGYFEKRWSAPMATVLDALREWVRGGVEPDLGALRAACPSDPRPPVKWLAVDQARSSVSTAQLVGVTSRVGGDVARALLRPGGGVVLEAGRLVLTIPNAELEQALGREGSVIAMAADVELHAPLYAKAVGYDAPLSRFEAPDGAPMARTLFRTRATRTAWVRPAELPESFRAAVRRVLAWADGASLAIVTYFALEDAVREMVPPGVQVGHYGGLRGLDGWKDLDALATLGDPRPNLRIAVTEATYADIPWEPRVEQLARAELEQAHGRLRTVHRTRPGKACHVGEVMPGGSGWAQGRVEVVEVNGPTSRVTAGLETLRADVKRFGVREAASRLGISERTLWHRLKGGEP